MYIKKKYKTKVKKWKNKYKIEKESLYLWRIIQFIHVIYLWLEKNKGSKKWLIISTTNNCSR